MSNFNIQKPSQSHLYENPTDFGMVNQLLKNKLYDIPERLRTKVINSAEIILESGETLAKLAAARLILEADKRNLELMKILAPQKHVHFNVSEATTDELLVKLQDAHERFITQESIDAD